MAKKKSVPTDGEKLSTADEAGRRGKAQIKREKALSTENNKETADNQTREAQSILNDEFSSPKPEEPPRPKEPDYKCLPADPDLQYPVPRPGKPPLPKEPVYKSIPAELDPDDPKRRELIEYNQKLESDYELQIKNNDTIYRQNLEKWETDEARFVYKQKVTWELEMHRVHDHNQKLKADYEAQLNSREEDYQMMLEEWEKRIKDFLEEKKNSNKKTDPLNEG